MTIELYYLALTTVLTAVLWIPYLANAMVVRGIKSVLSGAPHDTDIKLSPWAGRVRAAHANAVENLSIFTALVLVANAAELSTPITAASAMIYFWARVAHYVIYALGISVLRTATFMVGWFALIAIAWQVFTVHPS